jgi:hypothetical protein
VQWDSTGGSGRDGDRDTRGARTEGRLPLASFVAFLVIGDGAMRRVAPIAGLVFDAI